MFDPREFPITDQPVWHSGIYRLVDGRWYQSRNRQTVVRVYSSNLNPLPSGFAPLANPGGWEKEHYSGYRDIDKGRIGPRLRVSTLCVWKNIVWSLGGVAREYGDAWRVHTLGVAMVDFPGIEPCASYGEMAKWPGVDYLDRAEVSALVLPGEVARVRVDVTPWDEERSAWLADRRVSWWRESLVSSPYLTAEQALVAVRRFAEAEGLVLGDYRLDLLEASRVRDGWRVWCPPPAVEGPGDLRLGWAVFYVADDGVVLRSSTQESIGDASQRLTDGLFQRSQAGPRIASTGPVDIGTEPVLL